MHPWNESAKIESCETSCHTLTVYAVCESVYLDKQSLLKNWTDSYLNDLTFTTTKIRHVKQYVRQNSLLQTLFVSQNANTRFSVYVRLQMRPASHSLSTMTSHGRLASDWSAGGRAPANSTPAPAPVVWHYSTMATSQEWCVLSCR